MKHNHSSNAVLPAVIKIAIADDHDLFREGLIALLKEYEELRVVLQVSNGKALIENINRYKPHIVLLDIEMPDMDGVETTRVLHEKFPGIKIIALTMHSEEAFIFEMIANGAHGFVPKHKTVEELVDAIYSVMETGRYYNDNIASAMINGSRGLLNSMRALPSQLTEKEREILKEICAQKTNKEIADELGVSVRTVENHRNSILYKTGTRNSAGLVVYAIKHKLISPLDL